MPHVTYRYMDFFSYYHEHRTVMKGLSLTPQLRFFRTHDPPTLPTNSILGVSFAISADAVPPASV